MPDDSQKIPATPQPVVPPAPAVPAAPSKVAKAAVPATGLRKPAPAPTRIGKDTTRQKSSSRFLVTIGLTLVFLFVLFVVLMVLVIAGGGEQSPALRALGLEATQIKSFLLTVINLSFGFLSLLFFVLAIIGIFRLLFAKKDDKEAKGKGIRMLLIGLLPMVMLMFLWLVLFKFISGIEIVSAQGKEEITVVTPADLTRLVAPVEVTFSSENVINAIQRQKLAVGAVTWDLNGDGVYETPVTDYTVSYLYKNKGVINVGLQVTLSDATLAPRTYTYLLPIADAQFDATPPSGIAPLTVQFDATALAEGKKIQSFDWDFESDGTFDVSGKDQARTRHTFPLVGKFKVTLRMIDENGAFQRYERDVDVTLSEKPLLSSIIEASPGLTGAIPLQISFDGSKSESLKGQITRYEWNFGDGTALQVGRSVSHVFNAPGTFTVTLKVADDTGKDAVGTVQVEAQVQSSAPQAKILTTPALDGQNIANGFVPLKVSFDASGSTDADNNIVDYEWTFGANDAKATGQKAEYTYEKAGDYTVGLLVRDATQLESRAAATIHVTEPGVKAIIKANPEEGTAPLIVQFDGSNSTAFNGKIVSYEWDFGDKSPITVTSALISHKYANIGTYNVKLRVVTNLNESGTSEQLIYVREIPLKACFNPSRRNGLAPITVTFDPKCSTGQISKFTWDFGDGNTSDDRKPNHTFETAGTYNVTLEVADGKNNVSTYSDVVVAEGQIKTQQP